MSSPASIKKHPVHPILVTIPIGLWVFALICDLVRLSGGEPIWSQVAFYCIGAGIAGAVIAAVPGLIDYLSIDEAEMKRIATYHLIVNLSAVLLFALNLWFRLRVSDHSTIPLMLSLLGVVAILVGGWLGGEMVYVKGMAVEAVEELARKTEQQPEPPRLRRVG